MRTTFVRCTGGHVAEREIPAPGSKRETELNALADSPETDWRREADPLVDGVAEDTEPLARPAKSASKADWVAYAVQEGQTEEDARAATRDQLADLYTDPEAVTPNGGDS
ncbi:hypothetical protein [Streptomyces sp. NRRL B-24720]|uniref:hypothetical protein n=1 Tax=Streptomyces sp. NRRL B-24720 TaxID=1476876 RepID=UPI000A865B39|nr:hypothetical protein [Streptomyces sp. NRRL B-24720]